MLPRSFIPASALLLSLTTGLFAQSTQPVTLKVGDPAPPLKVGQWIKGEPVKAIERGKVYVLDFWATWCPQCIIAMPHVTELAKKYPEMIFIAQNVQEDDPTAVKPFVDEQGDRLGYRVAMDDVSQEMPSGKPGVMNNTWLLASGHELLPCAIVVDKESKIAWIGHAGNVGLVLEQINAGTFDAKATAIKQARLAELNEKLKGVVKARDVDGVLAITKEMAALAPEDADGLAVYEFNFLAKNGRPDAARVRADGIARTSKNTQALNTLAWALATAPAPQPADLAIARVAIDRALEISGMKEADYLDTSARIYAVEKDWPKAVAVIEQAIRIAEENAKANLQRSLDAYQKQQLPAAE